jgi:NAD(P)-dependent dehydrogenase (short-subunit alcohol dehydrogenase family)
MAWVKPKRGCSRRRALRSSVADILESDAETVVADIRAGGGVATATKIDVTSEAEWIDLIANAVASYNRLDILVNNASISGSSVWPGCRPTSGFRPTSCGASQFEFEPRPNANV